MRVRAAVPLIALTMGAAALRSQDDAPPPVATLVAATNWSWQCDPIRFTVRVTGKAGATMVRTKQRAGDDELFPFEVERRDGDAFTPVRLPLRGRGENAACCLTPPKGTRIGDGEELLLEAELWYFAVVATPGRIRVRFQLEVCDSTTKDAPWVDIVTPWREIDILAQAGNAAHLLGDAAAAECAACEGMMAALNSTWARQSNYGPTNFGPRLPSLRHWQGSVPFAERIVADAATSFRLRARARLVLAYDAIERAGRMDRGARDEALGVANAHLAADELVAPAPSGGIEALPSGGFEPVRLMLLAASDGMSGGRDPRLARRELCERYPFFAMWWRHEAVELLGR